MGLFPIYLDIGTMMIAALTIGIAVDDTIHFMFRYQAEIKAGHSNREALAAAVTEAGRALAFTSIILFLGFSAMLTSAFLPTKYVGALSNVVIFMALAGDLILLPAILTRSGAREEASQAASGSGDLAGQES